MIKAYHAINMCNPHHLGGLKVFHQRDQIYTFCEPISATVTSIKVPLHSVGDDFLGVSFAQ